MNDFAKRIAALSPEQRSLLEQQLQQQGIQLPNTQAIPKRTIAKRQNDEILPLSFAQQRLWFLDQFQPGSPLYNVSAAMQLKGHLNIAVLQLTFNEIVRRHEILRTTFKTLKGQPVQVISPTLTLSLPVVDLRNIPANYRSAKVQQLATEELQQPFNLSTGSLLRTTVLQLDDDEHILLVTLHHIISDGWCRGVFIRELATLYEAFSQGKPSPLPELPIQYADFAIWQRQWLQGEKLASQLQYWKQQLDNSPALLNLPSDRPRPPVQTFRGARQSLSISQSLTEAIKTLSQQEAVTPFITLITIFHVLLHRYTGQHDIPIGLPISNRNWVEVEDLIGFFANTLVLRIRSSKHLTFRQLLSQVRHLALDAYAHQDLPFEKLVEELKLERNLSYNPLFQVLFAFQGVPLTKVELPNLTLQPFWVDGKTSRFDLTLNLSESSEGWSGIFEYNTDIFDRATIVRMIGHFQTLLENVVSNPDQQLTEVSLIGETERHQLLVEWNETEVAYPQQQCIHQLFEQQAERTPDAIAVVFEDQQLTYQELNHRANQLSHFLQALGVRPETLVGICLERSLEMVIALLGVLKAGGAYVPLDPSYPSTRTTFILKDAQVSILLTQSALLDALPPLPHTLCLDTHWSTIAACCCTNPGVVVPPEQGSYVIYTSGSTGQPKGVSIPHCALTNFLHSMAQCPGLSSADRLLSVTTIAFDIAALELYLPLISGARLGVVSRHVAWDGVQLSRVMDEFETTTLQATPATWQLLLATGWVGNSSVRVFCGGEALSPELAHQLLEKSAAVWNLYGPTETTIWSAVSRLEAECAVVPLGQPIANTQLYVLDGQQQPVPIGVAGELHIGGVQLARGYLQRPALTAERFIPNPFSSEPGARLYKTGDLVRYRADGTIEYLGRLDHQVKIRGFRIELGEIETVLSQYPQVSQAVVLARLSDRGDHQLVAYIVPHPAIALSVTELRAFLREKLPEYMVPAGFVELDTLPLTPNGKIDRKALAASHPISPDLEQGYQAPITALEQTIASLWQEILQLEKVGIHHNFFDLGGHSLLVATVHSRLQKITQQEFPLIAMFQYPTISALAGYLNQAKNQLSSSQNTGYSKDRITSTRHHKQIRQQHRKQIAKKGRSL